jgi:hypothetical protein
VGAIYIEPGACALRYGARFRIKGGWQDRDSKVRRLMLPALGRRRIDGYEKTAVIVSALQLSDSIIITHFSEDAS